MDWTDRVALVTSVVLSQWTHMKFCRCTQCYLRSEPEDWEVYRKGNGVVATFKPTGWTLFSELWPFGHARV